MGTCVSVVCLACIPPDKGLAGHPLFPLAKLQCPCLVVAPVQCGVCGLLLRGCHQLQ